MKMAEKAVIRNFRTTATVDLVIAAFDKKKG